MKLPTLLVAGWAVLAALTPACTPQPLPADPQAETPGQQDDPAPQDTPDPVDPPKPEDPSGPAVDPGQDPGEVPSTPETGGNKTLVVWYSFTGNSTAIARALLSHISADALEIRPAEEGLDYAANNYAIGSSLIAAIRANPSSAASYPAIKAVDVAFGDYETILIVTPLWWSQMAAPMQGFLFQNGTKMAGKNIGLIVTSASSGISGVEQDARRLVPEGKFLSESLWIRSSQVGRAPELTAAWYDKMFPVPQDETAMNMRITAGGRSFTAEIEDSATGRAFWGKLPLTLDMSELNGNEKYCYGVSLPENDRYYDRIEAGDLMLYSGSCVVLFYGSAGGYSYTRIGKVTDSAGLAQALGSAGVSVTFEKL